LVSLPEDRQTQHHWRQTAKMILDKADVADVSRRIELALFETASSTSERCMADASHPSAHWPVRQ
jgi:hypothetical protein